MGFLVYIEIGLVLLMAGIVLFVLKLAKRDKAASLDKSIGKSSDR